MNKIRCDGQDIYPSKIVCIGRNYADHIKEFDNELSQEAVIFMKPNSAIADEVYCHPHDLIHYEGEISFLIKAGELHAVAFGLDLTKRDLQRQLKNKGWPWERAKAFDRSAVFSEFVRFQGDVRHIRMEFYINDKLVQQASYELMLGKPLEVLRETKRFLTYENGDILMTGTPQGVGPVTAGDQYLGKIFASNTLLVAGTWTVK
jgi:2-keto-4-pentenoate hydratase/2-oxohepta-3-ene-1,7-dioic acid hydratase in catechol pathway